MMLQGCQMAKLPSKTQSNSMPLFKYLDSKSALPHIQFMHVFSALQCDYRILSLVSLKPRYVLVKRNAETGCGNSDSVRINEV